MLIYWAAFFSAINTNWFPKLGFLAIHLKFQTLSSDDIKYRYCIVTKMGGVARGGYVTIVKHCFLKGNIINKYIYIYVLSDSRICIVNREK